jgi:DNA polymerase-3 subunit epsilon
MRTSLIGSRGYMLLEFERPIVCFDVETTGTNFDRDRIVQLALIKLYPGGEMNEWQSLFNPGIPIPIESSKIHGITDEQVANMPSFKDQAAILVKGFEGCDVMGYNVDFDIGMVRKEMSRIKGPDPFTGARIIDVFRLYTLKNPRTLSDCYREYTGKELEGAHDAMVDVRATIEAFEGQLRKHEDLPRRVRKLTDLLSTPTNPNAIDPQGKIIWRNGEACIGFGKHNGTPLNQVDKGYLEWILKGQFSPEVHAIVGDALKGVYPTRD